MNTREDMDTALREVVVPGLRDQGFRGSLPHFRRIRDAVDLITFQFDRNGGGFVVETAKGDREGFTTHWGKHIPAKKLTAWDFHPDQRKRIIPKTDRSTTESWFRYDGKEDCVLVAQTALKLILEETEV